jgi:F-type H+-transporting ATPase subunit a
MELSPDRNVLLRWGALEISETMVVTWGVMALLVGLSLLATARMTPGPSASRWQLSLEILVEEIRAQIRGAAQEDPGPFLPFIGTLFLFIAASSLVGTIPGVTAPTASLSTTVALAATVFVAVPAYGIARSGVVGYLRHYVRPTPFMLPFHVVSELSRTLALAVRLFGNIMSGTLIVGILLTVVPFVFPVVMEAFGLLIGFIQAYVFAVLSLVYIVSASRSHRERADREESEDGTGRADEAAHERTKGEGSAGSPRERTEEEEEEEEKPGTAAGTEPAEGEDGDPDDDRARARRRDPSNEDVDHGSG